MNLRFFAGRCFSIKSFFRRYYLPYKVDFGNGFSTLERGIIINNIDSQSLPNVSVSHIKKCLTNFEITYKDGFTCLIIPCPFCQTKETLFINKASGFVICNKCQRSGSWKSVESFLFKPNGKSAITPDPGLEDGANIWNQISKNFQGIGNMKSTAVQKVLSSCKCEDVPLEVLNDLGTQIDTGNNELFIPLQNGDSVVGYKKLSIDGESSYPLQRAKGVISTRRQSETAVIVQSVRDLFALASKVPDEVVCLPEGQTCLPQEILPIFEEYKKLVLWFGNEAGAWDAVRTFSKKLNERRCYLVRPLENQPRPEIAVSNGLDVNKIISSAQPVAHASITTFAELREDVLSELYNIDQVSGVKWERFPTLNSLLKGHRRGELTVLTGPTGSGKTTFMSEYSLDLAEQGVTTLWGSFEIRNQRLARMMLQQHVRLPLDEHLEKFDAWADDFQRIPLYFMTFHGQQSLELVMEAVEHAAYVHDLAHVVIDNVQFMLGLSNTETGFLDRFYRQDALIAAFRNFATLRNVHVTLVIHPRKEREGEQLSANSIFGGAKASQEADNIIIIQQKSLQSLKVKKFLQVAKNRYSGDVGVMPLNFDRSTLCFSKVKSDSVSN